MNIGEYNERLKTLEEVFKSKRHALITECARANNTVNLGDIIEDHVGKIRVERQEAGLDFSDQPEMIYRGVWFTKAGHENKNGEFRVVYQHNIVVSE